MKNVRPLSKARRKAERLQRLGDQQATCLYCGCSEALLLRPVTRAFLEEHHIVGRANDPDATVFLCLNCHALAGEKLLAAGVTMKREPDAMKFAANLFKALAVHHRMLSDASWEFAEVIESHENKERRK